MLSHSLILRPVPRLFKGGGGVKLSCAGGGVSSCVKLYYAKILPFPQTQLECNAQLQIKENTRASINYGRLPSRGKKFHITGFGVNNSREGCRYTPPPPTPPLTGLVLCPVRNVVFYFGNFKLLTPYSLVVRCPSDTSALHL